MKSQKLLWIILFNLVIIVCEIVFGLISNSFALIADALHNAGDVIAIVITYIAIKVGLKQTTYQYTFGFLKAEMMAAFVNTLFLFVTMFYMIYISLFRFFDPQPIEAGYMIVVGLIAVLANGISAYLLYQLGVSSCASDHNHTGHEDANIKSAYLHMLSDALISLGVVIAGVFIYYFDVYRIDAILTIVFSIYILIHAYPLLKESFLSLMDANTHHLTEPELAALIQKDDRVLEFHDLHITKPSSKHDFISFHIVLDNDELTLKAIEQIVDDIKQRLRNYGFTHIIIQTDSKAMLQHQTKCNIGGESHV